MEEKKNVYVIVIVVAVIGLLLSCVVGALAGGAAGLLVARNRTRDVVQQTLQDELPGLPFSEMPWFNDELPTPLPGEEDEVLPFEMPRMAGRGALITEVIAGTPAEEAGLAAGDIITAIDRTPVDSTHPLSDVVAQYEPGDRATLTVWRSGQSETIRVTFGENPDAAGEPYLGIFYRMMGPNFQSPGS